MSHAKVPSRSSAKAALAGIAAMITLVAMGTQVLATTPAPALAAHGQVELA